MDLIDIIVLSVVEGVTEFLPISSTGHLMAISAWLGLESSPFLSSFQIFIQLGAILAVITLYARRLMADLGLIKKVLVAFVPTAAIGLVLYPIIKNILFESLEIVAWTLLVGGVVLIVFEIWYGKREATRVKELTDLTYTQAALVGLFQALAVVPGVSRAGATIVGGLSLGLSRTAIVEFSFLLATPTMLAATAFDLLQTSRSFSLTEYLMLIIGFGLSFLFALFAVKWLILFIERHNFIWFGVYRILAAVAIFVFLL